MEMNLKQEILQNRYDIIALQTMVIFLSGETIPEKWSKYWELSHQYAKSKLKERFPDGNFIDFTDPEAALEALKKLTKA